MNLYSTSYKKQIRDRISHEWKDTAYQFNEVIVLAESLEEARKKSIRLISERYNKDRSIRGYITEKTHQIDGVFLLHDGYSTGASLIKFK